MYMKVAANTVSSCFRSQVRHFSVRQVGIPETAKYAAYLEQSGKIISPFHDVPLQPSGTSPGTVNMVVEVPRWSNAKMEISKDLKLNPIVQDVKKGNLRYVSNIFPFKGYIHNYGALPQTWEDPQHKDETGYTGDNDPVDVCEIGNCGAHIGQVKQVKILGCLAMIDEGETDWKMIGISTEDPLAEKMHGIKDVETHMPGLLSATRNWFRDYKIPDGKPRNEFAFGGEYKDRDYALEVISTTHRAWKQLIQGERKDTGISLTNTTHSGLESCDRNAGLEVEEARGLDVTADQTNGHDSGSKWYYV